MDADNDSGGGPKLSNELEKMLGGAAKGGESNPFGISDDVIQVRVTTLHSVQIYFLKVETKPVDQYSMCHLRSFLSH